MSTFVGYPAGLRPEALPPLQAIISSSSSPPGLSTGALVGIAIGGALVLIGLVGLVYMLRRRRRRMNVSGTGPTDESGWKRNHLGDNYDGAMIEPFRSPILDFNHGGGSCFEVPTLISLGSGRGTRLYTTQPEDRRDNNLPSQNVQTLSSISPVLVSHRAFGSECDLPIASTTLLQSRASPVTTSNIGSRQTDTTLSHEESDTDSAPEIGPNSSCVTSAKSCYSPTSDRARLDAVPEVYRAEDGCRAPDESSFSTRVELPPVYMDTRDR